jgi:hypothetical protein
MYKSEITNVPEGCTCEVTEIVNLISGNEVKGYVDSFECSICQALRESQATEAATTRTTNRIKELKNMIITLTIEKEKATTLGYSDLATEKQNQIDAAQTELTALEE